MDINILDCTLRDGGYYNNWRFDNNLVAKYLLAMKESGVDIVELGYRFFPRSEFYGPYAYCSEDFLSLLNLPNGIEYALMIDEKDVNNHNKGCEYFFKDCFVHKEKSRISIVRVAVHPNRIRYAKKICLILKELGYKVCLNIMQVHNCTAREIEYFSEIISTWKCINVVYFADSIGILTPCKIRDIFLSIKKKWHGMVGFHAHDNCSNALNNTLASKKIGCTWLDSTVNGMGRGAGNTPTEMLLLEINKNRLNLDNLESLFKLVLEEFTHLKNEYNWGGNLLYQLSAIKNVHPTYVQNLSGNASYDASSMLNVINYLSKNNGHVYSEDKLHDAHSENKSSVGKSNLCGYFLQKNILIIGPGDSVLDNRKMLELLIEKHDLIVLSTDFNSCLNNLVDYFISSNFLKNYSKIKNTFLSKSKLIAPASSLSSNDFCSQILDYEINITKDNFDIFDNYVNLPSDKSLLYALAVSVVSKSNSTYLAGFDGYNCKDARQKEVGGGLNIFEKKYGFKNIYSLTDTTYNIPVRSLYETWI